MAVKIEAVNGEKLEPFEYGNVFAREEIAGSARLRVGLDEAHGAAVAALAGALRGPFQLLYVLHTTRTGAELGRYESPELTSVEVLAFLTEYGRFLCEDARHDLWVRSHDDDATIVLDRHNLVYLYGPLDVFETTLQSLGARGGEPAALGTHVHHYHPEWDDAERRVLHAFEWERRPLPQSDVQFDSARDHHERERETCTRRPGSSPEHT